MLLAGISAMVWWYASQKAEAELELVPAADPLRTWSPTPSQRATLKYFWVVSALILVQILMGVVTAHYGVEGNGFYGIKISDILPYSVTRTWHVQIGIFWIATAWLEYWRWWVVHLWVEDFFVVFATTVIAFFFTRLGLIRPALAARSALLSATIFLAGGIIGTCHHLYFAGIPTVALTFGSVFSALEVVPLTMVAYSDVDDLRRGRLAPWAERYRCRFTSSWR